MKSVVGLLVVVAVCGSCLVFVGCVPTASTVSQTAREQAYAEALRVYSLEQAEYDRLRIRNDESKDDYKRASTPELKKLAADILSVTNKEFEIQQERTKRAWETREAAWKALHPTKAN